MPLRRDQPHLLGWTSQRLSGLTSPCLLSGQTSPHLLSGRTSLCLSDQTSHRLVWSWILSWLGWATRLSAGEIVFGCVPVIMMSHRFNFPSLHLCVGKHQFQSRAEQSTNPHLTLSTSLAWCGALASTWGDAVGSVADSDVWSEVKVFKCNAWHVNSIYWYF